MVGVPYRGLVVRVGGSHAEQQRSTSEVVSAGRIEQHKDLYGPAEIERRPCFFPILENPKALKVP